MRFVDSYLVKFVLYSIEKINEWPINVDKPILLKFCKLYPDQYVKLNILDFYLENDRRIVTDVALINVIEDSKLATKWNYEFHRNLVIAYLSIRDTLIFGLGKIVEQYS